MSMSRDSDLRLFVNLLKLCNSTNNLQPNHYRETYSARHNHLKIHSAIYYVYIYIYIYIYIYLKSVTVFYNGLHSLQLDELLGTGIIPNQICCYAN